MPSGLWMDLVIAPGNMQGAVRLEFDVARRLNADRSTFGGIIKLPVEMSHELKRTPLMLSGALRFAGEQEGLAIPAQTPLVNENTLRIPISDEQLQRLEDKRAGGAPMFDLTLRGIGTVNNEVVILNCTHPLNLPIPIEEWIKVLDQLGFGKHRLIELPPVPKRNEKVWNEAAVQIEAAARRLLTADSGAAMTEARTALQRTLDAVAISLNITPLKGSPIGPFADQIAEKLAVLHQAKSDDPYKALADAVRLAKSTAGFASDPPHSGFSTAERIHAELALSIATTLYTYFAKTVR